MMWYTHHHFNKLWLFIGWCSSRQKTQDCSSSSPTSSSQRSRWWRWRRWGCWGRWRRWRRWWINNNLIAFNPIITYIVICVEVERSSLLLTYNMTIVYCNTIVWCCGVRQVHSTPLIIVIRGNCVMCLHFTHATVNVISNLTFLFVYVSNAVFCLYIFQGLMFGLWYFLKSWK